MGREIGNFTDNFYKKSVTLARFSEKLPDDGHRRPKHVGATVQYFNVNFNILYV
jgi:hypothetical protein